MKKLTFSLLIALTILTLVAACSPAATPTPTATKPPQATATSAPKATTTSAPKPTATSAPKATATSAPAVTRLTDAEMEALITEKARDKHTLQFILSKDITAAEWLKTLDKMISLGAKISPDEKAMIIDWLVARKK